LRGNDRFPLYGVARVLTALEAKLGIAATKSIFNHQPAQTSADE
jgi:hypothetical protein